MKSLLFLCTGNYYRSRFAELYFRHLVQLEELPWRVDSRGLELNTANEGLLSRHTIHHCEVLGISTHPLRRPLALQESDLIDSDLTIALKETEHRQMMRVKFPLWEDRIEYWDVHDLDVATAAETLPYLQQKVELLIRTMRRESEISAR